MNGHLQGALRPFQYAACLAIQDLLADTRAEPTPIVLTGLSSSGKSYTVERMNEALGRFGTDPAARIASCDAMELIAADGGIQADRLPAGPLVVTATPLGTKVLREAGLGFREVPMIEPIHKKAEARGVPLVLNNRFVLWQTGLPGSAAFQEMTQEYQDDYDVDRLFVRIFDYMEYNFGLEVSADMYRYLPASLVDAFKQRQERKQQTDDIVHYINYKIGQHNNRDPETPLMGLGLSNDSRELWGRLLAQDAIGAPFVNILATELSEEQERLLQQQLFPGQQPGFASYSDFSGMIALIDSGKHDYSLRDRQVRHWARVRLPGAAGGTLEDSDFRLNYDAFTSYFACRFMDHGPSSLESVASGVITTEALLQTAKIPYAARIAVGRDFEPCEYSVDSEGKVTTLQQSRKY